MYDFIEKLRDFEARQEPRYEAQRKARRELIAARQAAGYDIPWHEVVLRENAEKGPAWMLFNNKFYQSLSLKPPKLETVPKIEAVAEEV